MSHDPFLEISSLQKLTRMASSQASRGLVDTHGRLTAEGVTNILKLCEAVWIHSGDPKDPHTVTRAGECTNGYVDVLRALRYTQVSEILAYHLTHAIERKLDQMDHSGLIEWVVGSDHAGATFSHDVARWLGAQHDFTEKGPDKTQLWNRFTIGSDELVLQIEELMTTSATMLAVRNGIRKGNKGEVKFAPVVGTIVHRSSVYEIEKSPVVYLVHYDIRTWPQTECPLCKAGSKRIIEPKKNWYELTRTYS